MRIAEIIAKLELLRPKFEAEGVEHLAIFGSRARGDYTESSDLDLLIDAAPLRKFSILNLVGVEHIVADSIGLPVNAFMRRSLDVSFKRSISSEIVEIF